MGEIGITGFPHGSVPVLFLHCHAFTHYGVRIPAKRMGAYVDSIPRIEI